MMEVFYRIYPGGAENRPFYNNNKLALACSCLLSFMQSCEASKEKINITALLDDCTESWRTIIEDLLSVWMWGTTKIVHLDGIGNKPSFLAQLDLALESNADIIYFAEDDYLYTKDAVRKMCLFGREVPDFFTPYDHPDRYSRDDNRDDGKVAIRLVGNHHWRTAESTCMTFGGRKSLFVEMEPLLREHACAGRKLWYPMIDLGYELWSPIPSLATHVMSGYMAPCVRWQRCVP